MTLTNVTLIVVLLSAFLAACARRLIGWAIPDRFNYVVATWIGRLALRLARTHAAQVEATDLLGSVRADYGSPEVRPIAASLPVLRRCAYGQWRGAARVIWIFTAAALLLLSFCPLSAEIVAGPLQWLAASSLAMMTAFLLHLAAEPDRLTGRRYATCACGWLVTSLTLLFAVWVAAPLARSWDDTVALRIHGVQSELHKTPIRVDQYSATNSDPRLLAMYGLCVMFFSLCLWGGFVSFGNYRQAAGSKLTPI